MHATPQPPPPVRRSPHNGARWRLALAGVLLLTLVGCTPSLYKRDVTAEVQGPSTIRVGEEVFLAVRLHYSDGSVFPTQPSEYNPSANAMAVWVSSDPTRATVGRETGLVKGIAPGDVLITATPSSTTTGTGNLTPGTLRITVTN